MSYPLLHELLNLVERYEELCAPGEQSMDGFLRFAQQEKAENPKAKDGATEMKKVDDAYLNAMIARDISFVYRYMRYFVRKVIKDSPLQTIDEYSYLISVMSHHKLSKTELNNYNVVEKTSGSEIIRRLLSNGLVTQSRNPQDKRSMILSITPEGRKALQSVMPHMQQSCNLLLRDLSWDQKMYLHTLHSQLCESNHPLFLSERDTDLTELVKKVPTETGSTSADKQASSHSISKL